MIKFERYPHINELIDHYLDDLNNEKARIIMQSGVSNEEEAELLSRFVWEMVGKMNIDEDNNIEVLGATDNSEMFPDLNYEIGTYMRETGFYPVWQKVSDEEMGL